MNVVANFEALKKYTITLRLNSPMEVQSTILTEEQHNSGTYVTVQAVLRMVIVLSIEQRHIG